MIVLPLCCGELELVVPLYYGKLQLVVPLCCGELQLVVPQYYSEMQLVVPLCYGCLGGGISIYCQLVLL